MAESVLLGMQGTTTTECAYVESDIVPGVDFFAHKVCGAGGSLVSNQKATCAFLRGNSQPCMRKYLLISGLYVCLRNS